jgi:PAS domain S-box-containing protein
MILNIDKNESFDFEILFELSPIILGISTLNDGRYVKVNKQFLKTSEFEENEVIGKTSKELGLFTDFSDRERMASILKKNGRIENLELNIKTKNGKILTVLFSSEKLNSDLLITSVKDITQLKKTEEELRENINKLRVIYDAATVSIVTVDLDKKILDCNQSFCDLLGYTKDELKQKYVADITFKEDIEIGMSELNDIIDGKTTHARLIKRYVQKSGNIVWGEISISLIRNIEGQPMYFLPIIRDITERKKNDEEILNRNYELEKFNKLAVDRELKMIELKKVINELQDKLKNLSEDKI